MPKCSMRPPIASSAAGITSRRSAIAEAPNTMTSSAPCLSTSSIARASAVSLVRHAPLGDDRGAGGRQPLGGDLQRLVDHLGREPRQQRSRPRRPCGCDRARRGPAAACAAASAASRAAAGDRERNDLHRRDHLAGDHRLVGRQRRQRDRLVDAVEPVDGVLVDHQHARRACANRLARPVKARSTCTPSPRDRRGDLGRRGVFGDVAGLEPRHDEVLDAGGFERRDLGGADQRAFFEHQRALADGVHGGARRRASFGATAPNFMTRPPRRRARPAASSRSRSVICAMIATAISAGETAPMSSPIGAWMRAMSASVTPCCLSRSTRRAWVFRDPSAPI